MTASVSNLVFVKVFTVVADVGDKNGLQCGGCLPAYLEVLRSMGSIVSTVVSLGKRVTGISLFSIIRLSFAFVLSRVFHNYVGGSYYYLLMGQICELQQVMPANNRHHLISVLSARPLREYILNVIM